MDDVSDERTVRYAEVAREMVGAMTMREILADRTPLQLAVTWAVEAETIVEEQETTYRGDEARFKLELHTAIDMANVWAGIAQAIGTVGLTGNHTVEMLLPTVDHEDREG